jgi:hypothetical protein
MDERYITIAVEEYKALIEFQLRKQIEAEYAEEIGDLEAQLHSATTEAEYWEKMYKVRSDECEELYKKVNELARSAAKGVA